MDFTQALLPSKKRRGETEGAAAGKAQTLPAAGTGEERKSFLPACWGGGCRRSPWEGGGEPPAESEGYVKNKSVVSSYVCAIWVAACCEEMYIDCTAKKI